MKERPIIFSGPMVRTILEGRKTQTRRVIKPQPPKGTELDRNSFYLGPYGFPAERLWVRESMFCGEDGLWRYSADNGQVGVEGKDALAMVVWAHHKEQDYCPSIYMPRWASRITLEITNVRVQRIQEIGEEEIIAEGVSTTLRESEAVFDLAHKWRTLWDSINGKRHAWSSNPWVWAITFKKMESR